ncbi:MAG: L,D-transpeptidase [Prevotella sp.]|jgi:hypothetical protein|nr:L,D-transpeptidase [Prevotella sp.]
MKKFILISFIIINILAPYSCTRTSETEEKQEDTIVANDTTEVKEEIKQEEQKKLTAADILIEKDFMYEQYTLEDTYPYKDTTRTFKWNQIKEHLANLENMQQKPTQWGILQNYKNKNGEASLIRNWKRNEYKRVADTLGVERYQSVTLYLPEDTITGERYGRDGSLVEIIENDTTSRFMRVATTYHGGEWLVTRKYIKLIIDSVVFHKAIFVDRKDENITVLEKKDDKWLVRSMNPATTGLHRPPYQQETPLGMFVLQEKKQKMHFLVDGTSDIAGFAPYANRFTNGGYIHGIPVNKPRTALIEYSQSLGTTPRSHMCVRNATSHAKFIYDWAPTEGTIIFVIE